VLDDRHRPPARSPRHAPGRAAAGARPLHAHRDPRRLRPGAEGAKVAAWQSGVYEAKPANADLLAFTLDKSTGSVLPHHPVPRLRHQPRAHPLGEPVLDPRRQRHRPAVPHHEREGRRHLLFARLHRRPGLLVPRPRPLPQPRGRTPDGRHLGARPPAVGDLHQSFAAARRLTAPTPARPATSPPRSASWSRSTPTAAGSSMSIWPGPRPSSPPIARSRGATGSRPRHPSPACAVQSTLPGAAVSGARGLLSSWRGAARGLRDDLRAQQAAASSASAEGRAAQPQLGAPAWTPEEAEQARRSAVSLRFRLEQHPKEHARLRSSVLQIAPSNAREVRDGYVAEPFVVGDARHMSQVADGSVALVVTSPPYFAGKQYEEELGAEGVPGLVPRVPRDAHRRVRRVRTGARARRPHRRQRGEPRPQALPEPLGRRDPHPPGRPRPAAARRDPLAEGRGGQRLVRVGVVPQAHQPGAARHHRAGRGGQQGPLRPGA
jgi:hypothetical protein